MARAVRSASCGSKLAASPSGIGNTVRMPWITSAASSTGMPSRLSSTATRWISRPWAAPTPLNRQPTLPARTCSSTWAALLTFTSGFTSGANGRTMSANTPS